MATAVMKASGKVEKAEICFVV